MNGIQAKSNFTESVKKLPIRQIFVAAPTSRDVAARRRRERFGAGEVGMELLISVAGAIR